MKPFSEDGIFWAVVNPANRVPGRLTFSSPSGLSLTLSDHLEPDKPPSSTEADISVIHGQTFEHGKLTLTDTFRSREEEKPSLSVKRQVLLPSRAFLGNHLPANPRIRSAAASFAHLDNWMENS